MLMRRIEALTVRILEIIFLQTNWLAVRRLRFTIIIQGLEVGTLVMLGFKMLPVDSAFIVQVIVELPRSLP